VSDGDKRIALFEKTTTDNTPLNTRYQFGNHLGSAVLELDGQAQIISYEEYHPYGTSAYRYGRTDTEVEEKRYRYSGKERDAETGLYYYGARYYAAWLGRWVSCDPEEFIDGINLFYFVKNQPAVKLDKKGTQTLEEEEIEYHQSSINNIIKWNSHKPSLSKEELSEMIGGIDGRTFLGNDKYGVLSAMLNSFIRENILNEAIKYIIYNEELSMRNSASIHGIQKLIIEERIMRIVLEGHYPRLLEIEKKKQPVMSTHGTTSAGRYQDFKQIENLSNQLIFSTIIVPALIVTSRFIPGGANFLSGLPSKLLLKVPLSIRIASTTFFNAGMPIGLHSKAAVASFWTLAAIEFTMGYFSPTPLGVGPYNPRVFFDLGTIARLFVEDLKNVKIESPKLNISNKQMQNVWSTPSDNHQLKLD